MTSGNDNLLRRSLAANSVFSVLSGLTAALFSHDLGVLMNVNPVILIVVGLGVLVFGLATAWVATRDVVDLRLARSIAFADVAWVLGAAALLLFLPGAISDQGRALLGVISLVVGLFAAIQAQGIRRVTGPKRLVTEIEITAPAEDVWDVLTSFARYADWNPHITKGEGHVRVGERLKLQMSMGNGRHATMRPTVTEAAPGRSFEWLGHLWVRGVFDGRHRFDLETLDGETRLIHSEEFTGVLVPLLAPMLDRTTRAGFEAMNEAVKNRVESRQTTGA